MAKIRSAVAAAEGVLASSRRVERVQAAARRVVDSSPVKMVVGCAILVTWLLSVLQVRVRACVRACVARAG